MKRLIIVLLIGFIASATFTSCGKYEEGPMISLRSKTARLVGEWELDKAELSGEDVTETFHEDFGYVFNKDETFEFTQAGVTITGDWYFSEDKTQLFVHADDDQTPEKFYILRLTNDELYLEKEIGDEITVFYFVAVE